MENEFSGTSKIIASLDHDNYDAVMERLDQIGIIVQTKTDNKAENTLSNRSIFEDIDENDVTLKTEKSYTDKKGNYHEGLTETLGNLEKEIKETILQDSKDQSQQRIRDSRRRAALIRAELSRRQKAREELRSKYDIDEKGNVTLDNLAKMFYDLNSNKAIGKLFEKVYKVLKQLNVDFRFTEKLPGGTQGKAKIMAIIT